MLKRVLEPEVMDTAEEAGEYDAMNHGDVNRRFCDDLLALEPSPRHVLDVGTGTALIPIELCRRVERCRVVATDLAEHMLAIARRNVDRAGLHQRIELTRVDAKASPLPARAFDVVMSNSIVHHIPQPADAFAEMIRLLAPGGLLFVRDLERPDDDAALARLVATYAADESPSARALLSLSLHAALTVEEVRAIARAYGVPPEVIATTSDRHWTVAWRASF